MSLDELADAYWEFQARWDNSPEPGEDARVSELDWAYEAVGAYARGKPFTDWDAEEAGIPARADAEPGIDRLDFLLLLAERAPNDDCMGDLGAGPLEAYLGSNPDVPRVDALAVRSARFRLALTEAWYESKLPPEDVARLRRFGRGPG